MWSRSFHLGRARSWSQRRRMFSASSTRLSARFYYDERSCLDRAAARRRACCCDQIHRGSRDAALSRRSLPHRREAGILRRARVLLAFAGIRYVNHSWADFRTVLRQVSDHIPSRTPTWGPRTSRHSLLTLACAGSGWPMVLAAALRLRALARQPKLWISSLHGVHLVLRATSPGSRWFIAGAFRGVGAGRSRRRLAR